MHHVTLKRHKKPYKRPRFNVGRKLALVARLKASEEVGTAPEAELKASEGVGTAPEAELKGMMGRKLVAVAELGDVIGARVAPEAGLRR